ncbi:FIST N-terminal domain-containing protein [soil metagenome]
MTKTAAAFSGRGSASECAAEVVAQIREQESSTPSALVVFASPTLDLKELLTLLESNLHPSAMVGCSSAGEFAGGSQTEEGVSVLAIHSDEIRFHTCQGSGIREDAVRAAGEFAECLGADPFEHPYRYVLLLTDALAGFTEVFLTKVNQATAGTYQLFGGGAGDGDRFQNTYVFSGTEVLKDSAVGLAILSKKPLGIGVRHGWTPLSEPMRATETEGFELVSLNAEPALDVVTRYAEETGQRFDPANPLSFFLHNVIGVTSTDGYKIRVPLGITERGGIICATEVPAGATVRIMGTDENSAVEAANEATETALSQIGDRTPAGVLFFDCVATRLRLGAHFGGELAAVRNQTSPAAFVGCNTYGQVARIDGQFNGFHNCTAVVCVIPS